MANILDRVLSNVQCCGISLTFDDTSVPSTIAGWQPFYNTTFQNSNMQKAYAGIASIEFSEESITSISGTSYKQKASFRFPAHDKDRANRITLIQKIKYVHILMDDKSTITIGRNDFFQNTLPSIKVKTNQQLCEVDFEVISISPAGFTPTINQYGLPVLIPFSI